MNMKNCIGCKEFLCTDVDKMSYALPDINIDPQQITILMISEAPPNDPKDYFYWKDNPFYMKTTINAFKDAGISISSIQDIIELGIYITTAIKCGKIGYSVSSGSIKNCSYILEKEMSYFPNIKCFLLMGDVAIKSFNYIAKRIIDKRVIPSGSTYKIRNNQFYYETKRVFPSYLQTGKNYLIEKSKRRMIAEDIKNAINCIK
ncbi:MAG: uracil-DNA glycosylase family protein [Candidatus Methanofastidiosia archaeon]